MSVGLVTRGLYGPQGGSSVSQATGGLYVARWATAAVVAVLTGLELVTQGGGLLFQLRGGAPRLPTVGGAVIVREQ